MFVEVLYLVLVVFQEDKINHLHKVLQVGGKGRPGDAPDHLLDHLLSGEPSDDLILVHPARKYP